MTKMLVVLGGIISLGFYFTSTDTYNQFLFVPAEFFSTANGSKPESTPMYCYTTPYSSSQTDATTVKADLPFQVSPVAKKQVAKPATKGTTASAKNSSSAITININVVPEMMQFTKTTITVKAGQKVTLIFDNGDNMQHNLVIIKPGTSEKVGAAADEIARDPKGALKHYVPQMPEVLHATKLLDPEASSTLQFTAPALPGDYPYICTFPGHWRIMKGVMKVVK